MKKKIVNAKIVSNKRIAEDHYEMDLKTAALAKNSLPGQFVNVKLDEKATDPLLRIPLGIHKIKKEGISLLYKVVGEGTDLLRNKKKGDQISLLGPLGKGFDIKKENEAFVIAGGHGIAPLYALTKELKKNKIDTIFFIGAGKEKHIFCADKIRKMGAKVYIATEDGSLGFKGYVTDVLEKYLERNKLQVSRVTIYACGPKPMLKAVAQIAETKKIEGQVSMDEYMACGIGACMGCAIKTKDGYKLCCKDGPVFDIKEIVW